MKAKNKIIVLSIPEYIKCKICDRHFKTISASHLKKHGIPMSMYRKMFPNALLACSTTRMKHSKIQKENIKKNPKLYSRTTEEMKKMRDALNEESLKKKIESEKAIFSMPEHKKRNSKLMKRRWEDDKFRENQRKLTSKRNKDRWKDEEYKIQHTEEKHHMYDKHHSNDTKNKITKGINIFYQEQRGYSKEDAIIIINELKNVGLNQYEIAEYLGNISQSDISHWCKQENIEWEKPSMKGNNNPMFGRKRDDIQRDKFGHFLQKVDG